VASSCLPISGSTLVYGSNDGGKTVLNSDPAVNGLVEKLCKNLNLKGHYCGRDTKVFIYSPGDLEAHKGKDGRVYVLDTARMFPPLRPDKTKRGSFLYRLMRPEFVKSYSKPLSRHVTGLVPLCTLCLLYSFALQRFLFWIWCP
jgi:hypothetical protein